MKIFLKLLICSVLISCATSPTGRRQLALLPDSYMSQMGDQAFSEQKKKTRTNTDSRTNAYVRCVVDPILQAVGRVDGVANWEVVVFQDDQVNAFALPGGHIGVYTGLFKAAQSADQLAAVLGHEVGHVLAQHSNERVSEAFLATGTLAAVDAATRKGNKNHGLLMAALGLTVQFGYVLPHSRSQESEADVVGLDLMARAGFNPQESVQLWKNMSKTAGGSPPEFMSTHPSHNTRISDLTKNMPNAMAKFEARRSLNSLPKCSL